MAGPKKEAKSGIDAAEEWVLENWYWILAALAAYLIFAFGFQYAVARFMLSLIGVIILGRGAWVLWVHYIRQDFISGIDYVLLEIIPPREVLRSPKAMELFITNALYHWSIKGERRTSR